MITLPRSTGLTLGVLFEGTAQCDEDSAKLGHAVTLTYTTNATMTSGALPVGLGTSRQVQSLATVTL